MPSRTDPKNEAVIRNIEQHPALVTLKSGPDALPFVRARVSTQLTPGPHKNQYVVHIHHIYVFPTNFVEVEEFGL
jgi:hypothetical protein